MYVFFLLLSSFISGIAVIYWVEALVSPVFVVATYAIAGLLILPVHLLLNNYFKQKETVPPGKTQRVLDFLETVSNSFVFGAMCVLLVLCILYNNPVSKETVTILPGQFKIVPSKTTPAWSKIEYTVLGHETQVDFPNEHIKKGMTLELEIYRCYFDLNFETKFSFYYGKKIGEYLP